MKKDTYYFSHDFNARNDVKILFLRQQMGMEGYGIFWYIVESLADSGGIMPMKIIPVLAMQMQTTEVKVRAVICQFELFIIEDEQFYSERLNQHLQKRIEIKELNSIKGKISAEKRRNLTAVEQRLNCGSTKEKKGKEIKGNESDNTLSLKNSNLFRQPQIPTLEEVKLAFSSSGGTVQMAEIFFNKHSATGWFLNSSPITNFRNLIPNFITNFNKNESKQSKNRNQQTNESINYLKQKGNELYNRIKQNKEVD